MVPGKDPDVPGLSPCLPADRAHRFRCDTDPRNSNLTKLNDGFGRDSYLYNPFTAPQLAFSTAVASHSSSNIWEASM